MDNKVKNFAKVDFIVQLENGRIRKTGQYEDFVGY